MPIQCAAAVLMIGLLSPLAVAMPLEDEKPRSLADIHVELRQLERETARVETDAERAVNILSLCRLFVEIGQHPELPQSPTLQSLSVRLRARLAGIEKRTMQELRRRQIPQPASMIEQEKAFRKSRVSGAVRPGRGTGGSTSDSPATPSLPIGKTDSAGSGHAGPGGLPDYGWGLVDLIRKTIRPDYWSTAGGPGKAIYFGQARALVIHGSWRVQEDVADLLEALRGGG